MYGWIWQRLPGSRRTRTATTAAILVVLLAVLWLVVFPWAASHLPIDGGPITS